MYVVTLMAATEPTVVGGIMTFFGYGVLPFSIVFYLAGSKRRRARAIQSSLHATNGAAIVPDNGHVVTAEGAAAGPAVGHVCGDGAASADGGCGSH
jgi:hypothetical protein